MSLEAELQRHIPRTVLALDEAQILMPARGSQLGAAGPGFLRAGGTELRPFIMACYAATQGCDLRCSSESDRHLHRSSAERVADDIQAVCGLLQNARPKIVRYGGLVVNLNCLI